MKYIQIYTDAACTDLYGSIPCKQVTFSSMTGSPANVTVGDDTFSIIGQVGGNLVILNGMSQIKASPAFASSRNRYSTSTTFYCKNGFSFSVVEVGTGTCNTGRCYKDSTLIAEGGQIIVDSSNPARLDCIEITYGSKKYYGFTNWYGNNATVVLYCLSTEEFWEGSFRPDYDYGEGTKEGGEGTGKIPHENITMTTTPTRVVPFGGRGLHAYRINTSAYASIQGYLWGDNSTLAKSLWQKFQNKTHTPVSCIVGCYSLPSDFMPSGSTATGVQLAGLLLSPISGTCVDVSGNLGFCDVTYTFDAIEPPFDSWLDYTGVRCILHVPFCGTMEVGAEYVMGKSISLRYRVDQLNGNTVCCVHSDGRIIAELSGNCAYQVPVSGGDDGTLKQLGALLTGTLQLTAGNAAGAMQSAAEAAAAEYNVSIANCNLAGSITACENRVPYIEWIYPQTQYTPDYMTANGVPCEFSGTLTQFAGGYGEFETMSGTHGGTDDFWIPNATDGEKEEIRRLLKEGVFV